MDASCVTCTPCAPGLYKAAVSTEACEACPKDTYRETPGATELGNCVGCLAKSSTNGAVGQTQLERMRLRQRLLPHRGRRHRRCVHGLPAGADL